MPTGNQILVRCSYYHCTLGREVEASILTLEVIPVVSGDLLAWDCGPG